MAAVLLGKENKILATYFAVPLLLFNIYSMHINYSPMLIKTDPQKSFAYVNNE